MQELPAKCLHHRKTGTTSPMQREEHPALSADKAEDSEGRVETSCLSSPKARNKRGDKLKPALGERGSKPRLPLLAQHTKSHRGKLANPSHKVRKHHKTTASGQASPQFPDITEKRATAGRRAGEAASQLSGQLPGEDEFSAEGSPQRIKSMKTVLPTQESNSLRTKVPPEASSLNSPSVTKSLPRSWQQKEKKDGITEEVALSRHANDPVGSPGPAITKAPRVSGETTVFPDQGSCSGSAEMRRSCHSADSSGLYRPDGFTVGLVALLCAVFVVLLFLVIRIVGPRGLHNVGFALDVWVKEMEKQCSSADCLNAVEIIAASMDVSADPCTNFYAFVCGHWNPMVTARKKVPSSTSADRNVSYLASLRSDYVAAVNDSLWSVASRSMPYGEQVIQMGVVYGSCLAFFAERPLNLTTAWRAANVFIDLWMQAKTFQQSLFLAVTHLLNSRLLSALYVTYDGQVVDIAPGTAILRHVSAEFRYVIVTRAVKMLVEIDNHIHRGSDHQLHADEIAGRGSRVFEKEITDALVKIDDFIFSIAAIPPVAPVEAPLNKLDTSLWNWTAVLAAQASMELMALPLTARVTNLDGVRGILECLSSQKELLVPKIYLMLVPLAEVFAFEERVRVHRHVPADDFKYEVCVTALETMFGDVYRRWIMTELVGSEAAADVNHMLSGVLTAANMQLEISQGAVLDYGKMVAARYPLRMFSQSNETKPIVMANYGSDFIANAVLFLAGGGRSTKPLLDFDALLSSWTDGEIAERLLIPDFYYSQASEHVLNYGTVGYYLARLAFQAGSPWQQASNSALGWNLTEHTRCLSTYMRDTSRLEVTGDETWWRDVVQVRWASEAGFRASVLRDSQVAEERALAQLFYLRLGHTFCAMPATGIRRNIAATALRVSAITLPTFARTFGCPITVGPRC